MAEREEWGKLDSGLRHGVSAVDAFYDFGEKDAVKGMKAAALRTDHTTVEILDIYTKNNVERMYIVRTQQAAIMSRNASLRNRTIHFQARLGDGKVQRRKHGNMITNTVQRRAMKDFKLQQQKLLTKSGRHKKQAEAALKESIAAGKKKAKTAVASRAVKKQGVQKPAKIIQKTEKKKTAKK